MWLLILKFPLRALNTGTDVKMHNCGVELYENENENDKLKISR